MAGGKSDTFKVLEEKWETCKWFAFVTPTSSTGGEVYVADKGEKPPPPKGKASVHFDMVVGNVPVFPTLYVGIAAALAAGVLAYLLRRRVAVKKTVEM